jgi:hypothetical protein
VLRQYLSQNKLIIKFVKLLKKKERRGEARSGVWGRRL